MPTIGMVRGSTWVSTIVGVDLFECVDVDASFPPIVALDREAMPSECTSTLF